MVDIEKAPTLLNQSIKRYFATFTELGLEPNTAAAYSLNSASKALKVVDIPALCAAADGGDDETAVHAQLKCFFSSAEALFASVALHCCSQSSTPRIDFRQLSSNYEKIFRGELRGTEVTDQAGKLLSDLLPESLGSCPPFVQAVVMISLLLLPHMQDVSWHASMLLPLMRLFRRQQAACWCELAALLAALPPPLLAAAVFSVQQFITMRLYCHLTLDASVAAAASLLAALHAANASQNCALPQEVFYNDVVNSDDFDLWGDWQRAALCRIGGGGAAAASSDSPALPPVTRLPLSQFSFCHFPFLYDAAAKARLLRYDAAEATREGLMRGMLTEGSPWLCLSVRRGPQLARDALTQIRAATRAGGDALRKPLKVRFVGEAGVDEGGVSKEFFSLIIEDCFSPNYGMFELLPGDRTFWFRASTLADVTAEFELVGMLIGLAVYNGHVLDLALPRAAYALLLSTPPCLDELADVAPDTHSSLTRLLEHPAESVEADFGLTFQVSHEVDFCTVDADLVPGGAAVPVTSANRGAFVEAYTRFLLRDRIAPQAGAFCRGFRRICESDVLRMFTPAELEHAACGGRAVDFAELRRVARYDGGYSGDSDVVTWLWDALMAYGEAEKRAFLRFVMSSDRSPVGGLAALDPPFLIIKNGGHSERLPTAHTCFNALLLPQYESRAVLEERLALALRNTQGFGLT